jgi:ABC-type sugar transport system ATPase subunit
VVILDEPTKGIDVGAKYQIYQMIRSLAEEGKGVVFISSELPELTGVCDRICVMKAGQVVGEVARTDFDDERILSMCF